MRPTFLFAQESRQRSAPRLPGPAGGPRCGRPAGPVAKLAGLCAAVVGQRDRTSPGEPSSLGGSEGNKKRHAWKMEPVTNKSGSFRPIPDLATAPPLRMISWLDFPLADIESGPPTSSAATSAVQRVRSVGFNAQRISLQQSKLPHTGSRRAGVRRVAVVQRASHECPQHAKFGHPMGEFHSCERSH